MWVERGKNGRGFVAAARRVKGRMTAKIQAIYRYPVKGLSPQPMPSVRLERGETLPADRLYAIENGPSGFDAAAPKYFPKIRFLMLMRNANLATLRTDYDEPTHTLTIEHEGREAVRADLRTPAGKLAVETFFRRFMPKGLRGPPKVRHAEGHSFSDVSKKVVSIINLASVAAVENAAGQALDPLRFRGNLHVSGWPAWREFDLLGQQISIGENARLKIVKRIVRCAATQVDPTTGVRDIDVPGVLMKAFDHMDCGVYGEVVTSGDIAVGNSLGEEARLV
jgi:uncharacterized protein YcbX